MTGKMYYISSRNSVIRSGNPAGLGLSLIPAVIYSQLFSQKLLAGYTSGSRLVITVMVIAAYMALSQIPYICIAVAVANMVMYIGMLWVLVDKFTGGWIRMVLKVGIAVAIVLAEIGICSTVMGKRK